MLCLHRGKSEGKVIKNCFLIFSEAVTELKKQPVLGLDIFSAHHWMTIFKFAVKSLILELRICMSNPLVQQLLFFFLFITPLEHVKT